MRISNRIAALALALSVSVYSRPLLADSVTGDKGADMLVDLVVTRPIGLAATVIGSAVFVLGLPFTIPSGSVGESACALIARPAAYTFKRPLGELGECSGDNCRPCTEREPQDSRHPSPDFNQ
jgi:hypothetical protein